MKKITYILNNQKTRILATTVIGFIINFFYGIGNGILGIMTNSWWLITLSAYYIIISIMRFLIILNQLGNKGSEDFIKLFSGYMFFVLDVVLVGTTILAAEENSGTKYHEIIMITIAAYSFMKIIIAIINLCKSKKSGSPAITTIRNISFADAAVSIFSLQRSMLVSFGNKSYSDIRIFNILTGIGVCLLVMILGINLIRKDKEKMAQSKLVKINEKIADHVKGGFKKIENTVVGSYEKIEKTVVGGYEKIEDAFVDRYLTHDGETVEEAKKRLKNSH